MELRKTNSLRPTGRDFRVWLFVTARKGWTWSGALSQSANKINGNTSFIFKMMQVFCIHLSE